MNEALKVIYNRRSIRKYKAEQIAEAELKEIMTAAINAPNAGNRQQWHFTVIQNKAVLDKVKTVMKENMLNSGVDFMVKRASEPGFVPFFDAPLLIIISGDEKSKFGGIDCGAAAENIALAAESLNIGSCLMTSSEFLFAGEKGNELMMELGIPEGYRHVCAVTLGYKDGENPPAKPRNQEAIHYIK
jgi:nitroreductase